VSKHDTAEVLFIEGREVRITHPDKPYFSKQTKVSKLDLVRYYLSVAPGALAGISDRPLVLKRFVDGAEGQAFYQKRAPANGHHGCAPLRYHFRQAAKRRRLSSTTQPGSLGSLTWVALSYILILCAPVTSIIRTSCASTSILDRASPGKTSAVLLSK